MRQRLSALAIRRFIKNEENLSDDDLLKMVNNQQIQMTNKNCNDINCSIISDDEYFDRLSSSLNQYTNETEYYCKDLKDFSEKYQSNKCKRLLLSETPAPKSANPIFKESSFEKFDISEKYSYMKRASTIKPNLKSNSSIFISPKKSEEFYNEHRYLTNYSPPLLLQTIQQNVRNHSISSHYTKKSQKRSLINSKFSPRQPIQL
jgi:hypothetical protein